MDFCLQRKFVIRLLLSVSLLFTCHASALEPTTPLARLARQAWTMENGLPQNTVSVLLQSRNGYLWAGTELGLARFDGTGFQVFDHATLPVFPDAEIRCMFDGSGTQPDGSNGSLWVGTSDGLVRWQNGRPEVLTTRDGLPSNAIVSLLQTVDGQLWVRTESGLARWNGRSFLPLSATENGYPAGSITSIAADEGNGLWVGTTFGVALLRNGRWSRGNELGLPARLSPGPSLVTAVASGRVLLATPDGVYLEQQGAISPVLAKTALPRDGVSFLSRLTDGTIAVASKSTIVFASPAAAKDQSVERLAVSVQLPGSRIEAIYADREGNLWIGTNHGLGRIGPERKIGSAPASRTVQLLPASDPLAADAVVSFLEDREGDLWVGTESAGLHIFRDARFRTLGASDGLSAESTTAIVQDAKDALWVGTRDAGLNRLTASTSGPSSTPTSLTATYVTSANGLLSNVILSLAATSTGDLWVGTPDGLNRIVETNGARKITSFTSADGLPDDFIRSLLAAPDGSVWIGTRRGLTHLNHDRFQNYTEFDGLGSNLVGALTRTPDNDLWIATLNGLSHLHAGVIHNYTTADGLSSNVITALDVTPDGMLWIGTQGNGLNLWDGQRMLPIPVNSAEERGETISANTPSTKRFGQLPAVIHALLHDGRGHLWLASDSGLTRVDLDKLLFCAHGHDCRLNSAHFTTADGLRSRGTSSNSHPTACRTRDGRLWFTTPRGLVNVDPLHFAETPGAPPVAIERFAVDDRGIDEDSSGTYRIGAGHVRFQFDYVGLSFAAPQKLRYEYMLEGFDRNWTDAGTRRTAYYTNIPPGPYRFRVRATLGDGGFSDASGLASPSVAGPTPVFPEADLSFQLLPHLYQTLWFRFLLLLAVVAFVVLLFRRRLLRVRKQYNAVMAERSRIAREIHDTLAQGYVGISLQLEVLGELLRHHRADAASRHLALTQELVREGLDDARQSIWALRSQDAGEHNLPVRIRRMVEKAQAPNLNAHLAVHGAYRSLASATEKEVLRIAQEAIQNVKRHAEASEFHVRLDYDERSLTVTVSDDGKGFVVAPEETGKRGKATAAKSPLAGNGHYGLTGMQERANLIDAQLTVESAPGAGTTINLRVPAPEASGRDRNPGAGSHSPHESAGRPDSVQPTHETIERMGTKQP